MDARHSPVLRSALPRSGTRLRTIATVLAGFAAGAVAAAVVPALAERGRSNSAASDSATEARRTSDATERAQQLMTEARLRALEAAAARQASGKDEPERAPQASETPGEPPPSPDTRADHEERLAEHAREALDTGWASAKSEALGALLGAAADAHHFKAVQIDCRSATCAATLEWPSYGDALETMDHLLHNPAVPCGRQVVMPEPTDAAARYRTTVLYHDCS